LVPNQFELTNKLKHAQSAVSDVTRLVTMFIYEQNARLLFLGDVRLTEIVRECLSAERGLQ